MKDKSIQSIAIFDDDDDILVICNLYFKAKGWLVNTYTSCENIIAIINEAKPTIIVMDNWIPSSGGVAATQVLKNDDKFKNIPVIFCSANNDIEALTINAGADAYIRKPFELPELEAIIKTLIQ